MEEDIQFLKDLQFELKTQDNDCQAEPRFWVVMDYRWVVTGDGWHDRVSIVTPSDCESFSIDEFIDSVLAGEDRFGDEYTQDQLETLKDLKEWRDDDDLLEWAKENYDDDCYLIYEREEPYIVQDTMFLTKAEAKRHIEVNKHHYTEKAHTYAMTAWRAPKVERLLKILETFDWGSVIVSSN